MKLIALFVSALLSLPMFGQQDLFPDGTPIPEWFRQNEIVNIRDLGTAYNLADYGVVNDSTRRKRYRPSSTVPPSRAV